MTNISYIVEFFDWQQEKSRLNQTETSASVIPLSHNISIFCSRFKLLGFSIYLFRLWKQKKLKYSDFWIVNLWLILAETLIFLWVCDIGLKADFVLYSFRRSVRLLVRSGFPD